MKCACDVPMGRQESDKAEVELEKYTATQRTISNTKQDLRRVPGAGGFWANMQILSADSEVDKCTDPRHNNARFKRLLRNMNSKHMANPKRVCIIGNRRDLKSKGAPI